MLKEAKLGPCAHPCLVGSAGEEATAKKKKSLGRYVKIFRRSFSTSKQDERVCYHGQIQAADSE